MGLCTPVGSTLGEFRDNLRQGKTGIKSHEGIFSNRAAWAALVENFHPEEHFSDEERNRYDRTAQMGILAAKQALEDAGLHHQLQQYGNILARPNNALIFGTSHGGRSQLDRFVEGGSDLEKEGTAHRILETAAHYHQAAAIATYLKIHGQCITLSNACSSSGAAIAYSIELLRSGKTEWVLAGGADGFSKLTYAGFESLGAMADGPCAPFSDPIGMSLGDGSGFLILETLEHAVARKAHIYAELYGWGSSWDAYHITAPEPSGEGMNQAIDMAIHDAGIDKNQIDYINIHGTGTRANDASEAVGLTRYFANDGQGKVPPLSASKSLTGHMLGASSALGVIASIIGMNESWLPPTANFKNVRPGCELDAVPNVAREANIDFFLAQSAAFAGANAVVIGGKPGRKTRTNDSPVEAQDDIVISGMGVISPLGCSLESFAKSIEEMRSGIVATDAVSYLNEKGLECGAVVDFQPRKLMPTLNLRRVDRVASFATIAASLALKDSGLLPLQDQGRRNGLVVAITRGAATSYERYLESVAGEAWESASAVYFPNLVMSSVGGQISSSLGIRGITSSIVGGGNAGLQALIHAVELFRRNPRQDSVVVVASDELADLYLKLYSQRGWLKGRSDADSVVLGEGAVAFVLEKKKQNAARNGKAYATIAGYGLTHDAAILEPCALESGWMKVAADEAIRSAGWKPNSVDHVQTLSSGRFGIDQKEANTAKRWLDREPSSITSLTGFAEASSCLANLAACLLQKGDDASSAAQRCIVLAGSDDGNNAAIALQRMGSGS